jgi:hypothetical protein
MYLTQPTFMENLKFSDSQNLVDEWVNLDIGGKIMIIARFD